MRAELLVGEGGMWYYDIWGGGKRRERRGMRIKRSDGKVCSQKRKGNLDSGFGRPGGVCTSTVDEKS